MNGKLVEEQKESQIKIQQLEEQVAKLKLKAIDPSSYMKWDWEDVLMWILSLENGRYAKYEKVLRQSLSEEGVRGEYLRKVDASDVKGWGIKSFLDKKDLCKYIENLLETNAKQSNPCAAPVAFQNDQPEGGATAMYH